MTKQVRDLLAEADREEYLLGNLARARTLRAQAADILKGK